MEFLRRLAPPRVGDASRALPRLASRFSGDAATSHAPRFGIEAIAPMPDLPPATAPPPQRAGPATVLVDRVPSRPASPDSLATLRHAAVVVPFDAAPPDAPTEPAACRNAAPAMVVGVPDHGMAAPALARPLRSFDMGDPIHVRPLSAGIAWPAAPPVVASPAAVPPAPPARAAPISAAAIETLTAARVPPRPVIHVTIDRIDVRAPATAPRAAPANRSRSSMAPGVSLADYLRAGPRRRDGGAS